MMGKIQVVIYFRSRKGEVESADISILAHNHISISNSHLCLFFCLSYYSLASIQKKINLLDWRGMKSHVTAKEGCSLNLH